MSAKQELLVEAQNPPIASVVLPVAIPNRYEGGHIRLNRHKSNQATS